MKKQWIIIISAFVAILILTLFINTSKIAPVLDTDRCLKMPNTHCEVFRIPNGTVNISVDSVINGTYYYNYTY